MRRHSRRRKGAFNQLHVESVPCAGDELGGCRVTNMEVIEGKWKVNVLSVHCVSISI